MKIKKKKNSGIHNHLQIGQKIPERFVEDWIHYTNFIHSVKEIN